MPVYWLMVNREFEAYFKYAFLAFFVVILVLAFLIMRPFFGSIAIGLFLCYIFYPVYRRLNAVIKSPNVSSGIMTVCVLLLIILPIVLLVQLVTIEVIGLYGRMDLNGAIFWFSSYFSSDMQGILVDVARQVLALLASLVSDFVLSLPQKVLGALVIVLTMFVSFRGARRFVWYFKALLPIKPNYKEEFVARIKQTSDAVVLGVVTVSFLQGLVAMFGFYIFGLPSPALWGFLTFIASLLPVVGPAVIWAPFAVYLYLTGHVSAAVGLAFYSLVLQNLLLDFVFKTKIIGSKGKLSPLMVFLGIVGGVMAFGVVGILLGPIVLVLLMEFFNIYMGENAFKG